jgi:AcrR family transcriptional regulator
MSVFGTRGYHNGSLVEIAELAGMTHSGVLHHFGSKEQLLISMLEYRDDADVENYADHQAPRGAEFLKHLVETAQQNSMRPGIIQTYSVLSGESVTEGHPAQEFFRARLSGLREMLVNALTLATDGKADPTDISRAASGIIATMDGLQVQWLLDPDAVSMPEAVDLMIRSVLRELRS